MSLALIAALPFVGALLPGLAIRAGRNACALATAAVTALALALVVGHAPEVLGGAVITSRIDWLPGLGLAANFMLDGLGLLFALLILGIGLLIILYARFYLAAADPMGRFFTYLLLFQGAMLGIVLSDNILLLLVFWELTSLTSFLLIGFWQHTAEGRQGARMALVVTGGGGLAMVAGMLILGGVAGSYDLSVILTQRAAIQASDWYLPALILILLGAFTKSAQFPFHFWLPHAMAAPTPVSAYLHSATMVKAGLFLLARLWPVLAGTPEWFYLVTTTGLVTLLLGAKVALFKGDLKALLAYSTVSHLGLITMLLGFGTKVAALAAVFHIVNHASFKAALFMVAGMVEHATGSRDIARLGGLRAAMPITFAIATLAALAMAGVPPLNGYLSKEMMLEAAVHARYLGNPWLLGVLATAGAALSVGYSLRFIGHTFLGPQTGATPHPPHDPGPGLWAAPLVLVGLAVAIGIAPMAVAGWLVEAATFAVTGDAVPTQLALWHGVTPALVLSGLALGGGALVLAAHPALNRLWQATPRPDAKRMFDVAIALLATAAQAVTARLHDGALTRYLAILVGAVTGAGAAVFATALHSPGGHPVLPITLAPAVGWALLVVASVAVVVVHHARLLALVLLGVVGLMVAVGFAYLSAPDLALTQIAVEVATILLLLLALNFLPQVTPLESSLLRRARDGVIAAAAGLGAGGLIYALMTRDFAFPPIADYHLANALSGGGGHNVVNVILVDFRGYDTFGEITVLGIAALVIFALIDAVLRPGAADDRLRAWQPAHAPAGERHALLLVVTTRMILPIAVMVAVFFFLRGHNEPGGGFIAGLVVAIALVMHYMASGFAWSQARRAFSYHSLIAAGVLIAAGTGVGSWLLGRPFLTSAFGYVRVAPLEPFELATAMLFDTGVFFAVLGAVMLVLASISRLALRAGEGD